MSILFRILASISTRAANFHTHLRSAFWRARIQSAGGKVGVRFTAKTAFRLSGGAEAKVTIGNDVTFAEGASIFVGPGARLTIGDGVFVGRGTTIAANAEITIGPRTQIAHLATLIDTDHGFDDKNEKSAAIHVGSDVWIGASAIILKGRSLGDRSVVGAGAVVTHDVPDSAVVAGNPAQPIKR